MSSRKSLSNPEVLYACRGAGLESPIHMINYRIEVGVPGMLWGCKGNVWCLLWKDDNYEAIDVL